MAGESGGAGAQYWSDYIDKGGKIDAGGDVGRETGRKAAMGISRADRRSNGKETGGH